LTESKKKQAEYENGSKEQKEEIFNLAYTDFFGMINDTYNNYVIQKILEIGNFNFFCSIYYFKFFIFPYFEI